jgi:hypothetical protein
MLNKSFGEFGDMSTPQENPMRHCVFALVLALAVQAQAAPPDPSRPLDQQVTVQAGDFDAKVRYFGPSMRTKMIDSDTLSTYLTVTKDRKTGAVEWGAILSARYYGRWRSYESATLVTGKVLSAQNLGREVGLCDHGSCALSEGAGVVLDDPEVRAALQDGLRLRWNARGYGSFEVEFSAAYVAAMAEAIKR